MCVLHCVARVCVCVGGGALFCALVLMRTEYDCVGPSAGNSWESSYNAASQGVM